MRLITEVASAAGIKEEHLELYGKYKSKLAPSLWGRAEAQTGRQAGSGYRNESYTGR